MTLGVATAQSASNGQSLQQVSPVVSSGTISTLSPAQPISTGQTTLQAFQQQQAALLQARQTLIAQGATPQQLTAWRQQNAAQIAGLNQLASAMSVASAMQIMPVNLQPKIPASASQTLRDFLATQAALANARAQIHNQIVQQLAASGQAVISTQLSQLMQQQMQVFRQQHASDLQLQVQRAQTLAAESAPPPPLLSSNLLANEANQAQTSPTSRRQLMQARLQLLTQYATAPPSVRQAALQQWQQQAGLIKQAQTQAQPISQSSTAVSPPTTN